MQTTQLNSKHSNSIISFLSIFLLEKVHLCAYVHMHALRAGVPSVYICGLWLSNTTLLQALRYII